MSDVLHVLVFTMNGHFLRVKPQQNGEQTTSECLKMVLFGVRHLLILTYTVHMMMGKRKRKKKKLTKKAV